MSTLAASFLYSVEDVNQSIRQTNTLLRGANALRLLVKDIRQVWEAPNISRIFWTAIQFTRAYNAFRRIYKLTLTEANSTIKFTRLFKEIPVVDLPAPATIGASGSLFLDAFSDLNVRVEAFRENLPIALDQINIEDLPRETQQLLQQVFEEDAEETVTDAQEILVSRILHPEDSTGFLEASIGWMPEIFGTRVFANAFYAWWVEEGQRTFTGHHYMRGALDLARPRLSAKIRDELNRLILSETP